MTKNFHTQMLWHNFRWSERTQRGLSFHRFSLNETILFIFDFKWCTSILPTLAHFRFFVRYSLHIIRFIYLLLRKDPFSHSFTRPIHSLRWSKFELFRTQILRTFRNANNDFVLCRIFFHLPLSKRFHNIAPNLWFLCSHLHDENVQIFSSSIWLHAHSI